MKRICAGILAALLTAVLCLPGALGDMKKGDSGGDVPALQRRLERLGYPVGRVDGDYGKKTVAAVQAFQKDKGLPVTGNVDKATWDALYDEKEEAAADGYAASVALAPPFAYLEKKENEKGVRLCVSEDLKLSADLIRTQSMTYLAQYVLDYYENTVFAGDAANNAAKGYASTVVPFDSNGRVAVLIEASYDYTYEGSFVTAHLLWAAVELAKDDGGSVVLRTNTRLNTLRGGKTAFSGETLREVLARAELTGSPAPRGAAAESLEGDPILGSWYALMGNTALRMEFSADGSYVVYEADGTPWAAGVWSRSGDAYTADGTQALVFDGGSFTIGGTAFGREIVEQPSLPFARDAAAEDCLGVWNATGLYMSDEYGLYDGDANMLDGESAMTAVYDGTALTLTGISEDGEVYAAAWEDGSLRLTAEGSGTTFESAVMRLLEDGTAVLYAPGRSYITITLEKTH